MQMEDVKHPFDPIIYDDAKVLILGSFPSPISRKQNFYYANKNNRFWKVLQNIYDEEIIDYHVFCKEHKIALWDVIHSCTIKGASDSSITNVVVNDIGSLIEHTDIQTIFTTGNKATKLYQKYIHLDDIEHIGLPSTSSANAKMSLETLCSMYHVIKEKTDDK